MKLTSSCVQCILGKTNSLYSKFEENEQKKLTFMKEAMRIVIESDPKISIPYLSHLLMEYLGKETNTADFYEKEKTTYNQLLLSMEHQIAKSINESDDTLQAALKYAMAGNYIDFAVLDKVVTNDLLTMLEGIDSNLIDAKTVGNFRNDLAHANSLVYLADNAGEIVLDKLFVSVLQKLYPDVQIHFIVRGFPILNDATMHDAVEIGLHKMASVYGNGTSIPGTCLEYVDEEVRQLIESSDLIISKGQGNFESLYGCGLNIYYIFLCKCDHFVKRFKLQKLQGVFINENSISDYVNCN